MSTINGKACVVNNMPVDKVYSNGVQVYGRNMLINTASSATSGRTVIPGTFNAIAGAYSRTDSYEQVIAPSSWEFFYRFMIPNFNELYSLIPGETYTLSGRVSHTVGQLVFRAEYFRDGRYAKSGGTNVSDLGIPTSDGSVFTPFSYTFTVPVWASGTYFSLQNFYYTEGSLFRFKNMKLEKGNIATPWTPAPEDVGVGA
ncbi:host range and adsorption protein [Lactobacillus phage Ld17]|uniref:Putative adsorption protein n=1 Tax=Lactobacillus phage Ld17 TaxID=1500733 RepID=A0A075KK74_9CAUD|nr:host range and adsorption protein [Lactobacillus phage Ld17]AIF54395.1 putative adsorption protein [Lactobacillus phage Ld17]